METQSTTEKKSTKFHHFSKVIILIIVVIIFYIGYLFGASTDKNQTTDKIEESSQVRQKGNYKFINPLIECELYNNNGITQSSQLEKSTVTVAKKYLENPAIKDISIYFRDLNNGPWFGFNENTKFAPASLLKVPIMMAYLKEAQDKPAILEEKFTYQNVIPTDDVSKNTQTTPILKYGNKYTILKIIESMIAYSDNNAADILIKNKGEEYFNQINSDLMVPRPATSNLEENFITVREYASFFRILYNSSYLDRNMSEKALEILSTSNFKNGLVKELPPSTVISHKFGVRIANNLTQLHDCGVIYNPKTPYLLCIMTRGENLDLQEKTIAELSKNIWDEVSK